MGVKAKNGEKLIQMKKARKASRKLKGLEKKGKLKKHVSDRLHQINSQKAARKRQAALDVSPLSSFFWLSDHKSCNDYQVYQNQILIVLWKLFWLIWSKSKIVFNFKSLIFFVAGRGWLGSRSGEAFWWSTTSWDSSIGYARCWHRLGEYEFRLSQTKTRCSKLVVKTYTLASFFCWKF